MTNKVIEYIEITQNTQIALENRCFRYIRPQKSPKIAQKTITQSRFSQLFDRYGIFWVIPGESSCPDGSEYVWQRGVGDGWPKLILVSRFVAMQIRCYEKITLFYFWSDRLGTNITWALILGVYVCKYTYERFEYPWLFPVISLEKSGTLFTM